jgi:hypothetical protein
VDVPYARTTSANVEVGQGWRASLDSAIDPIEGLVDHGLVPGAVPCLDIGLDLLEEVRVRPLLRGEALGTERAHLSLNSFGF